MLNLNTAEEMRFLEFTVNGGKKVYKIPYLQCIPSDPYIDRIIEAAGANADEQATALLSVFCDLMDDYAPGVRKELTMSAIRQLLEAWQGDSTVSLGE